MANSYFQFKQFRVEQGQTPFKVGTDGVLLGAWVNCNDKTEILDAGCGTGLISLMLAQRCQANITALEIDNDAADQANDNFKNSPWPNRLNVFHQSFQEYASRTSNTFDLIVSNPPFFLNGIPNARPELSMARHENTLSIKSLLEWSAKCLRDNGNLAFVFPYRRYDEVLKMIKQNGFHVCRALFVRPTENKIFNRVCLEVQKSNLQAYRSEEMSMQDTSTGEYTPAFMSLTKAFYLHM